MGWLKVTHEQFRLLIFELLEHHLTELEDTYDDSNMNYHVDRCRWSIEYLKRYTVAKIPTQEEINDYLSR